MESTERFLQILLAVLAGCTVIVGLGLMAAIGGGRADLGGRLAVAVTALLILGAIDSQATRLVKRRAPATGQRHYALRSALGLVVAAAVLLGVAWFLP
jgi:hypothetical protein